MKNSNLLLSPDPAPAAVATPAAPAAPTLADVATESAAIQGQVKALHDRAMAHLVTVQKLKVNPANMTMARGALKTALVNINLHVQHCQAAVTAAKAAPAA